VGAEYVRFFQSLSIGDAQKEVFLGRLLQEFFSVAVKLDGHLAPVGATLHVAVSRMCEADNPTQAPQHRWIRVIDRLGFFGDEDDHASRVINVGLSYAYRHKELDVMSEATALRLRELRLSVANDNGRNTTITDPALIPSGVVVVARRPPGATGAADDANKDACADDVRAHGRYAEGAGSALLREEGAEVPPGGLTVRGPGADESPPAAGGMDAGSLPPSAGDAAFVQDGGMVVATRRQGVVALAAADGKSTDGGAQSGVESAGNGARDELKVTEMVNTDVTKLVSAVQPVVTPSAAAVECITGVLEGLAKREDLRDALQQLVNDSLLCLARFLGGATAQYSAGVLPADLKLSWPGVRRFMQKWWPVWEVPPDEPPAIPAPGTLAAKAHPTRQSLSSKWIIIVDMTTINPVLLRTTATCRRHFKKDLLDVVEVARVGPGMKYPVGVALATMLLVATQEEHYCSVLADLASVGRPRVPTVVPLLAAACHVFESDGLGAVEDMTPPSSARTPTIDDAAAAENEVDDTAVPLGADREQSAAASSTTTEDASATSGMTLEQRYEEMDLLLAEEKTATTGASRARRVAARRVARAPAPHVAAVREGPTGTGGTAARPPSKATGSVQGVGAPAVKRRRVAQASSSGGGAGASRPVGQPGKSGLALIAMCPPRRPPRPPPAAPSRRPAPRANAVEPAAIVGQGGTPTARAGAGGAGNEHGGLTTDKPTEHEYRVDDEPTAETSTAAPTAVARLPLSHEREQQWAAVAAAVQKSQSSVAALLARRQPSTGAPPSSSTSTRSGLEFLQFSSLTESTGRDDDDV